MPYDEYLKNKSKLKVYTFETPLYLYTVANIPYFCVCQQNTPARIKTRKKTRNFGACEHAKYDILSNASVPIAFYTNTLIVRSMKTFLRKFVSTVRAISVFHLVIGVMIFLRLDCSCLMLL